MVANESGSLAADWLVRHVFSFEVGPQRHVLSSTLVFEPDGTIDGYHHPNESRWRVDQDDLLILRSDGVVSCRARLALGTNGEPELAGPFLLDQGGSVHHFKPISTRADTSIIQSFDLFDTLVARYCFWPTAIFEAVEAKGRTQGFARLRQQVESELYSSGDYSLDDIYARIAAATAWPPALVERLKILELAEEWENLFPIREMVVRVQPDDIIITDMYLPLSFVKKIVHEKCGLPGVKIYLSNHGKHHGTIWGRLQDTHRILRHHGDNRFSDIDQARKNGIEAAHVNLHDWTFGERLLQSIGLDEFAKSLRKSRLTTFTFHKILRRAEMAQFCVNLPFLIVASLMLIRHAKSIGADCLLMCGRDCNLWIDLLKFMISISGDRIDSKYLTSSRDLFLAHDAGYVAYFSRMRGGRTVIADLSGTGRTSAQFISRLEAQADTSIYIVLKSDIVARSMDLQAPARSDVAIDFSIGNDGHRIFFEKLNAALEGRAVGMEFVGHDFRVTRVPSSLDALGIEIVSAMHGAFHTALEQFRDSQIKGLPDKVNDTELRNALEQMVNFSVAFKDVEMRMPEL